MQALPAGVNQYANWQIQLHQHGVLPLDGHAVALHERIAVVRHVGVRHIVTVQRVKAYPGADLRVEPADQFAGRAVIGAFCRHGLAVLGPDLRHIADQVRAVKQ